jgi:hypothetical protein
LSISSLICLQTALGAYAGRPTGAECCYIHAYDLSAAKPQLFQASYHRPENLSLSLELIPPHLLKINTSHPIPVPERDSSLKRVVDTPVCHFTVFPASKRAANLKIPYSF